MSPTITQIKSCPDCLEDAHLTGWRPSVGYDPKMREYSCPKCGHKFYVIGGDKTYKTPAEPIYKP